MNSIVFRIAIRFLMPVLLLFSLFLLLRGHNQPGGGFTGGLVAAAAFALYSLSYDADEARRMLSIPPVLLIASGLLIALSSGLIGLIAGRPFLTGLWINTYLPGIGRLEVGTPVLFDLGVYLLVFGITVTMVFALEEGA